MAPFRYSKLGYVALNVTDLDKTTQFALDIVGLADAGEGEQGERYFRCSRDHHNVVLHQASEPGFKRAGWALESDTDVENAYEHFEKLGLNPAWVPDEEKAPLGLSFAPVFRVREPFGGSCLEYYSKMEQKGRDFVPTHTNIQRVGHYAINVPDCRGATEYFVKNMGFKVSDYVGDLYVSLMRAFPNPRHHSLGVGQSMTGKPGFNHLNFMVTDINDIGRAYYRLKETDTNILFGMGRHPTSDSIFIYFEDPDGMTWEYSFGMELFPEEGAREPRVMSTKPEDFDLWGARPEPTFTKVGDIEQA